MADIKFTLAVYFMVLKYLTRLMSGLEKSKPTSAVLFLPRPKQLLTSLDFSTKLRFDQESIDSASTDYGHMVHNSPSAVLCPTSIHDILGLINFAFNSSTTFTISARGRGHSVRGQSMADNGVVVDMKSLREANDPAVGGVSVSRSEALGWYADVGGEQLWVDVLRETLKHGVAPVSWTDYLYLSVGGTLSNAGISGQSFRYGPQISNVFEMDVVTGTGELVTCSPHLNTDLFYGVLGGLGQFGIITRARIHLEPAPRRVKWVRMLYNDFSTFTRDQERLISIDETRQSNIALDYVEGSLQMDQGPPNNWRSSFYSSYDVPRIMSLVTHHRIIYCLEVAKYYYVDTAEPTLDTDLQGMLQGLNFVEGFKFERDVSFVEFLDRVRGGELKLESQGLWEVPHPWLNLFLPKSRISDFDVGIFRDILLNSNIAPGIVLFYPMKRDKWDDRMSAVIPDEKIFYAVGFLRSSTFENWQMYDDQNKDILNYCEKAGISIKQYLPEYTTKEQWMKHFGSKWTTFSERKARFDPKMMLSPGQRIFNTI